jgi:hypothetical protein
MIYLEVNFTYPPESGLPIFSNGFKNYDQVAEVAEYMTAG